MFRDEHINQELFSFFAHAQRDLANKLKPLILLSGTHAEMHFSNRVTRSRQQHPATFSLPFQTIAKSSREERSAHPTIPLDKSSPHLVFRNTEPKDRIRQVPNSATQIFHSSTRDYRDFGRVTAPPSCRGHGDLRSRGRCSICVERTRGGLPD